MRPTFICPTESVPETCEGEATKFESIPQWKLHRNHWPQRGWVVLRRLGVSTSKQHKGKKNPPEINSAQIWQVFHKRHDWEWLHGDECSLSKGLPNSNAAVWCPLVQTNLVQRQGSVNRLQRVFQFMQLLCLLHVVLQRFIQTDVLLEHGVRGVVQLPEKFTGQDTWITSLWTYNRLALKTQRFLDAGDYTVMKTQLAILYSLSANRCGKIVALAHFFSHFPQFRGSYTPNWINRVSLLDF